MQDAVLNDKRLLRWSELLKPTDAAAIAALRAVPDTLAIMNSSATALTRIGEALTCILALFNSQVLSPLLGKSFPEREAAQDDEVCLPELPAIS